MLFLPFPASRGEFVSHVPRMLASSVALLVSLMLAGCYESDEPLISKGEYIPQSGAMSCQSKIDGRRFTIDLKETKSGFPFFYSYTYREGDSTLTFKNMKDNLFLIQIKPDKDGIYKFAYIKFFPKTVTLYVPNTMQNGATIDNLIREAGIRVNASNPERIKLLGESDKRLEFLTKHDLNVLALFAECFKT